MKRILFATSALLLSFTTGNLTPAYAQQGGTSDPHAVQAGLYKVEPYHTQVGFTLLHMGFSNFSGFFSQASGTLNLDPAHIQSTRIDVTVPVSSVETTVAKLDGELRSADWFDAAQYPTARFVSNRVVQTGADTADVSGTLTLHGVSQPVTLKARLVGSGINPMNKKTTVGFEGTTTLSRSAFGVKRYVPLVADAVTLRISAAFER